MRRRLSSPRSALALVRQSRCVSLIFLYTDYARAAGHEGAPASTPAHTATAPKPAPANGPPSFAAAAESMKVIYASCRDRFHDDVNKVGTHFLSCTR